MILLYLILIKKRLCVKTKLEAIIFELFKVIVQGKVYWVRAKEVNGWNPVFCEDKYDSDSSDEESMGDGSEGMLGVNAKENVIEENSDVERVSESSFVHGSKKMHEQQEINNNDVNKSVHSEDPFKIYDIIKNQHGNGVQSSEEDNMQYPPGFTPVDYEVFSTQNKQNDGKSVHESKTEEVEDRLTSNSQEGLDKVECGKESDSSQRAKNIGIEKQNEGGSILELMDNLIKVGQKMGYYMDGCMENMEAIISAQGENGVFK